MKASADALPPRESTRRSPAEPDRGRVRRRVHHAVGKLPERERRLIELAYWSGLSLAEIATRLGIPPGAVKAQTRVALVRLAELLEHDRPSPHSDARRAGR